MLYLTNNRVTNKDELHLRKLNRVTNKDELHLCKLLYEKEMVKDYYKYFPTTKHYVRILHLNSEISFCKRKLSRNVTK